MNRPCRTGSETCSFSGSKEPTWCTSNINSCSEGKRPGERQGNPSRTSENRRCRERRRLQTMSSQDPRPRGVKCALEHDDKSRGEEKGHKRHPSPPTDTLLQNLKSVSGQALGRQEKEVDLFVAIKRKGSSRQELRHLASSFLRFHKRGHCRSGTNCPLLWVERTMQFAVWISREFLVCRMVPSSTSAKMTSQSHKSANI